MLIKIKSNNKTGVNTLYFECVYCKVNYNNGKEISSIDIKREYYYVKQRTIHKYRKNKIRRCEMQLIIAEKEDVAKEIARALAGEQINEKNYIICNDDNYIICWASGHLLRHKMPDEIDERYKSWKIEDLPIYFDNWEKTEIETIRNIFYTQF